MNKIQLNNIEFQIGSYNRNTVIYEERIESTANINIQSADMENIDILMQTDITVLKIYFNNEVIYELNNIHAHVSSVSEYLVDDHVEINISLTFDKE